jgi:hypothetical protein
MTRGYKPVVAIGEAQRRATAWGFILIGLVTEAKLPFDFVIRDNDRTSLIRVRRLKYSHYGISDIIRSCGQEIKELRELRIPDGIYRELWVRGPDRTWHRYLILEEGIEVRENDDNGLEENNPVGIPDVRQKLAAG